MAQLQFEQSVINSGDFRRRIALYVGLSMLLHASIVLWLKQSPIAPRFQESTSPITFDATLRSAFPDVDNSSTPPQLLDRNATVGQAGKTPRPPRREISRELPRSASEGSVTAQSAENTAPTPVREAKESRIDLDQAYRIAREFNRNSIDTRFDAAVNAGSALEAETPASRAIAKAARPDCRTTDAGKGHIFQGLLAIPSMIWDAARDTGCKW